MNYWSFDYYYRLKSLIRKLAKVTKSSPTGLSLEIRLSWHEERKSDRTEKVNANCTIWKNIFACHGLMQFHGN
jgi:hypothetical protein